MHSPREWVISEMLFSANLSWRGTEDRCASRWAMWEGERTEVEGSDDGMIGLFIIIDL